MKSDDMSLCDFSPARKFPYHPHADEGDKRDDDNEPGHCEISRQVVRLHIFLIVVQKQDMNQVNAKGTPAE